MSRVHRLQQDRAALLELQASARVREGADSEDGLGFVPGASCAKISNWTNYVGGCRGEGTKGGHKARASSMPSLHSTRHQEKELERFHQQQQKELEVLRPAAGLSNYTKTSGLKRPCGCRLESEASQWNATASGKRLLSKRAITELPRWQAMPSMDQEHSHKRCASQQLQGLQMPSSWCKAQTWLAQDGAVATGLGSTLLREEPHCSAGGDRGQLEAVTKNS